MERAHLSRLVVLRTVAELGSFRGAADRLGIAPSAVSQAVALLEADLGVRLLARTTRSTRPTDEGARLLERVGGALDELSKRIGFRVAPGLSERVIFRELFPRGLTLLDMAYVSDASVSHVAARAELRELIASLQLPLANRGAQEAVA